MTEEDEAGGGDPPDATGDSGGGFRFSVSPLLDPTEREMRALQEENSRLKAQLNEQRALVRSAVLRGGVEHEERNRMEVAWLSSTRVFGDWFECAEIPMSCIGSDGRIVQANRAQLDLLEYRRWEYVGHALAEFLMDPEVLNAVLAAVGGGSEVHDLQAAVHCKSGASRHVRISCRQFKGGFGGGICCFMKPIENGGGSSSNWTNDQYVRQLAEHIREVFWMTTANKETVLYVSPAYEAIWGRSCASLYQEPGSFLQGICEEDRARVIEALRSQATEGAYCEEYRVVRPDGAMRWIRDRAFPIRDENGNVQRIAGLAEDITEMREAEEKLRNYAARQKVLADLGRLALRESSMQRLFEEATARLSEAMGVEMAKVLEFKPTENRLLLRAGVGWEPGEVGVRVVDVGSSEAGFALLSRTPVIVGDRRNDGRFPASRELLEAGILSGMSVAIEGRFHPFGVLGVHSRKVRTFSQDEADFLQAIAHVLGAAIDRLEAEKGQQDLSVLLAQEKQTLNDTLANLPAIVWELRVDPESGELRLEYVSAYAEAMLGFTSEEFLSHPRLWEERIYPNDKERIREEMEKILAGGPVESLQFRWIARDGQIVWIDSTKRAFFDSDGKVLGLRGIAVNVTERKLEEAARREAEERFSDILASVPGIVWELRLNVETQTFEPYYISDYVEKLLGYPRENWMSNPSFWLDCVHPRDRERMKRRLFNLSVNEEDNVDQFRWVARDGRTVWVEARRKARRDETGEITGIRGVTVDITDQKVEHQERRAAEERFGDILSTIPGVVWQMDVTPDGRPGRLVFVSDYVETISGGYRAREFVENQALWRELLHPEDREKVEQSLGNLFRGEPSHRLLSRWSRRDGVTIWVEASHHLVLDDEGKPIAIRGVMIDVTERKRAEVERESVESRFRAFMDNSPLMASVKNEEGHLVYVNRAFQEWSDGLQIDWYGSTDYDFLPEEVARRVRRHDRETLEKNATTQMVETSYGKEGTLQFWSVLRFPIIDAEGRRFLGTVAIDVTSRRRLEKELLEIGDREQRRLGQELHDGVCQHLLGVAMMTQTLSERMSRKGLAEAAEVKTISGFLDEALALTRGLMQGLHLVNVEGPGGMPAALKEFCQTTTRLFGKMCEFRSSVGIDVKDGPIGSHLFRIAQEATHNAVKHGDPTRVIISLSRDGDVLVLKVDNDGNQLPPDFGSSPGFGMRTMKYRAGLIGADLSFENRREGGVCVACRIPAGPGLAIEFVE